jgi:hypothetical protein
MATSGVDRSDRNPEDAYDVDLRRIDPEERQSLRKGGINRQQGRVSKALTAVKAAGRYQKSMAGKDPAGAPYKYGGVFPGEGDKFGRQGGYGYAEKPSSFFGKFIGF